ncbi:MAG: transposase [Deinococcota bacterium]
MSGEIEVDEVYVVAGHKGKPKSVLTKGRSGQHRRLKGARGRGSSAQKDKPPIFGMLQRGGQVIINILNNVQQKTIQPIIQSCVQAKTPT